MNKDFLWQTILAGVTVFVLGQLIKEFWVNPILNYKGVVGKIDNKLKYFSSLIVSAPGLDVQDLKEAIIALREFSCDLEAAYKQIPFTKGALLYRLYFVPSRKNVAMAATDLIQLHNTASRSGTSTQNYKTMKHIRQLLKIEELDTVNHRHPQEM